jgi:hypothetical protein
MTTHSFRATFLRAALLAFVVLLGSHQAKAHKADESYVYLKVYTDHIEGFYQITVRDLNIGLGLELKDDITEEEINSYLPEIRSYIKDRSHFKSEFGEHDIKFTTIKLMRVSYGTFVSLMFQLENTDQIPDELEARYEVIYDKKPKHRNKLIQAYNWKAGILDNEAMVSLAFSPGDGTKMLDLTDASIWKGFVAMVESGMYHIYIGLDHILFLIALLLPAVVRRKKGATGILSGWEPVDAFRPAFFYVLKIVTFFTIAHTITLSLAATGLVNLPSRLVESLIALSIVLAAAHNIKPFRENETMGIAFVFGLFHGFGFASVLGEIGLGGEFMTISLLGFNIGVELAQVLIICLVFPVLYLLRNTKIYKPAILIGGSVILIIISLYWLYERAFDIELAAGYILWDTLDFIKSLFA